jgi:hypothetical protein
MIHVSHIHSPLTTGLPNISTQVNNMALLHLIYSGHTYVHHIDITIQLFLHTSSIFLGRPAGHDPSCGEQYSPGYTLIPAIFKIIYNNLIRFMKLSEITI